MSTINDHSPPLKLHLGVKYFGAQGRARIKTTSAGGPSGAQAMVTWSIVPASNYPTKSKRTQCVWLQGSCRVARRVMVLLQGRIDPVHLATG